MARHLLTISSLEEQIRGHEESHRNKDITIADLERSHSDKESIIRDHLLNIGQLENKLSFTEQTAFGKDAVIREHLNAHDEKNNMLESKESNIEFSYALICKNEFQKMTYLKMEKV